MDETYDSDSSDGSIVIPSSSVIPESSPANDPVSESYKANNILSSITPLIFVTGRRFRRSGGTVLNAVDGTFNRYRCCGHCQHKILKCAERGSGKTSYPIHHLRNRHFIDLNADDFYYTAVSDATS